MSITRYISGSTGLLGGISQYTYLLILSINPPLFKLFKPRHYVIFFLGLAGALFNHRALMPFMLLIILDLDYANLSTRIIRQLLLFFALGCAVITMFGGAP
jgi:hypothetical protein